MASRRVVGGIFTYFALPNEPDGRVGVVLLLAAVGLCLGFRNVPTGLAFAGAFLAFASGFAIAKLRTEMVRAPVHARAALCWSRRLCRGP